MGCERGLRKRKLMEERMNEEKHDSWKICVSTASRIHATLNQYLSRMSTRGQDRNGSMCVYLEKEYINTYIWWMYIYSVSLCVCIYI